MPRKSKYNRKYSDRDLFSIKKTLQDFSGASITHEQLLYIIARYKVSYENPEEDVEALIKKYGEITGKEVDRGDAIKVGDLQLVAGPNTMPEPALLEFVNMIGHEHIAEQKAKADARASAIEPPARG